MGDSRRAGEEAAAAAETLRVQAPLLADDWGNCWVEGAAFPGKTWLLASLKSREESNLPSGTTAPLSSQPFPNPPGDFLDTVSSQMPRFQSNPSSVQQRLP